MTNRPSTGQMPCCAKCGSWEVALVGAVAHWSAENGYWVVEDFLSPKTVECPKCNSVGDYELTTADESAAKIAEKWVRAFGWGFNPDNFGKDYSPALSAEQIADYNADMATLFEIASDPYDSAVEAMEKILGKK